MVTGWPNLSNPADNIFFLILGICIALLLLVTGLMVYFVIRYSRKRNPEPEDVKDNVALEVIWTVIPTILVLVIFYVGWKGFLYMRTVPADAMPIKVTARQFSWTFDYENGRQDSVLRVPVKKPVKLLITSADVLHSLYIPAYRIKEDAVPGRQTYLWFQPDQIGSYDLFCTEYCGVGHSAMMTKVEVLAGQDFQAWYDVKTGNSPERGSSDGAKLFQTKGCIACHSVDGTPKIGPSMKGIYGRQETVIQGGNDRLVTVDAVFIRNKLLHPEINRIKGFPPIMPPQQLNENEIDALIEYIKSLK